LIGASSTLNYNDITPLAEILREHFDQNDTEEELDYQDAINQLTQNKLRKLRDWKALKDTELKKIFGVKVINALDIAAGNQNIHGIFILTLN
jgi:hypothetical protein